MHVLSLPEVRRALGVLQARRSPGRGRNRAVCVEQEDVELQPLQEMRVYDALLRGRQYGATRGC